MAQLTPFQVELLASHFVQREGQHLVQAISTDKQTIYFQFDEEAYKFNFLHSGFYMQFIQADALPRRSTLQQFKELVGLQLLSVKPYHLDRSFAMEFEGGHTLVFRLFGRFCQMDLYADGQWLSAFPADSRSYENIPQSKGHSHPMTLELAFKEHKWLNKPDKQWLEERAYEGQEALWLELLHNKRLVRWKANTERVPVQLEESVDDGHNFGEELHTYSRYALPQLAFALLQERLLKKLKGNSQKLEKKCLAIHKQLKVLQNKLSYKDQADLLMAHMHSIESGSESVELERFDGSGSIRINLNRSLSPQANAERLYRKSKNQGKQFDVLKSQLKEWEGQLEKINREIEQVQQANDLKSLKKLDKNNPSDTTVRRLPYKRIVFKGFEIRIGKSAADNDELLRSHSSAQDLWFHAKGVSGSHLILRLNKGQKVPDDVLEYAASLAAHYSKAKTEELARVIYTYRKYIRKPKKAHPGAVIATQETSILVAPLSL